MLIIYSLLYCIIVIAAFMSRVETGSSVSTAGSTETYWIVGAVLGALVLLLLSLILIYLITRHKKRRKDSLQTVLQTAQPQVLQVIIFYLTFMCLVARKTYSKHPSAVLPKCDHLDHIRDDTCSPRVQSALSLVRPQISLKLSWTRTPLATEHAEHCARVSKLVL